MPNTTIPPLLSSPMVRKLEQFQVHLFVVSSIELKLSATLDSATPITHEQQHQQIQIGERCFVHLLSVHCKEGWPEGQPITYELKNGEDNIDLSQWGLLTENPNFVYKSNLTQVVQGSCRKPHHSAKDVFPALETRIKGQPQLRPDYLVMAGDQIYADDIAAPMLVAIQALSEKLGLYSATDHQLLTDEQRHWQHSINRRSELLPKKQNQSAIARWWHGDNIISSLYHDNHLLALDEFFACYLLTWSKAAWDLVWEQCQFAVKYIQPSQQKQYQQELEILVQFVEDLPSFETVIANTPTVMIFDDHDVTDDWNLTADWEQHVYGHPITKGIIKDALLSYCLFQGWGNDPERVTPLIGDIKKLSQQKDFANEQLTEDLLSFTQWHFQVDTTPQIVVLDTRTHRWRSESSLKKPSGLLDFERLLELEQQLYQAKKSILLVSAAPIFGVKAIEVVQKTCELIGKELLVDVENWMAHKGSAKKLMSILRDDRAPDEIITLSGDVHYSFCFSVERRFSSDTDKLWQLTCSGFKNEFPKGLLKVFDYIDRFLYSPHSILNLFTKRRKMEINHHPLLHSDGKIKPHLFSQAAAGWVELSDEGYLQRYYLLTNEGQTQEFDLEQE